MITSLSNDFQDTVAESLGLSGTPWHIRDQLCLHALVIGGWGRKWPASCRAIAGPSQDYSDYLVTTSCGHKKAAARKNVDFQQPWPQRRSFLPWWTVELASWLQKQLDKLHEDKIVTLKMNGVTSPLTPLTLVATWLYTYTDLHLRLMYTFEGALEWGYP